MGQEILAGDKLSQDTNMNSWPIIYSAANHRVIKELVVIHQHLINAI